MFKKLLTTLDSTSTEMEDIRNVGTFSEWIRSLGHEEIKSKDFQIVLNGILKKNYNILPSEETLENLSVFRKVIEIEFSKIFIEWLRDEINIPTPSQNNKFETEWFQLTQNLTESPHELFDNLANFANLESFKGFIAHDAAVHVPFHDTLAFMQIGTRGAIKNEFLENFSDEVGGENGAEDHLKVFSDMLKKLKVNTLGTEEKLSGALICANTLMILSLHREFYYEGIGYLGCLEHLTPSRFSNVLKAGRRLSISESDLDFYVEHAECDVEHAEAWVSDILTPVADGSIVSNKKILDGVRMRLFVSNLFWGQLNSVLFPPPADP
jgi:pyrroloquinoline quinone (PQQ) biosynthesis protein C